MDYLYLSGKIIHKVIRFFGGKQLPLLAGYL